MAASFRSVNSVYSPQVSGLIIHIFALEKGQKVTEILDSPSPKWSFDPGLNYDSYKSVTEGETMVPVIISGGSGTRLWPVSRTQFPKQFCNFWDQSLFELTLERCKKLGSPLVLTTVTLKDLTQKKLRQHALDPEASLYEPMARNTAPAIAWLCHHFLQKGRADEVVGIFPADQLIEEEGTFQNAIGMAEKLAAQGKVVTIGIQPTFPSTGFGYIQTEKLSLMNESLLRAHSVLKFHEKPDLKTAEAFIKHGGFHWNAGIFVFQIKKMEGHFEKHLPDLWKKITRIREDGSNLKEVYEGLDKVSLDYGIMEKLQPGELTCVPADLGWSDVGSWDAVAEITGRNAKNKERIFEIDGTGNAIFQLEGKSYALLGVDDLIVVDTGDALLVTKKGRSQDVKLVVDEVLKKNKKVVDQHVFEERPWGEYSVLRDESHYKVKSMRVLPGAQISYQSHEKRAEHWIIVKGKGEVVLNEKIIPVQYGMHIEIPAQSKHRIRNTGSETIEFIEVQTGSYFGEDDIKRFQDDYKRI